MLARANVRVRCQTAGSDLGLLEAIITNKTDKKLKAKDSWERHAALANPFTHRVGLVFVLRGGWCVWGRSWRSMARPSSPASPELKRETRQQGAGGEREKKGRLLYASRGTQ